jgi:hypothetical protein
MGLFGNWIPESQLMFVCFLCMFVLFHLLLFYGLLLQVTLSEIHFCNHG